MCACEFVFEYVPSGKTVLYKIVAPSLPGINNMSLPSWDGEYIGPVTSTTIEASRQSHDILFIM